MNTIDLLTRLEGHLWASANILRGPVDAADFKTYIFPLLFFKRICDVWDEEYRQIAEEMGDPELAQFPESHRRLSVDCCCSSISSRVSQTTAKLSDGQTNLASNSVGESAVCQI